MSTPGNTSSAILQAVTSGLFPNGSSPSGVPFLESTSLGSPQSTSPPVHNNMVPNQYLNYNPYNPYNSNNMWPDENWNSWNRVFKLVLLSFFSTIGSMGNIFIISTITVIDTFQVRGNSYLVSLAFGHLLVTLLVLPASSIAIMANATENKDICHWQWIITMATLVISVLSFLFMSIDNYYGMNTLVAYQSCCTKFRIFTFFTIIWTLGFFFAFIQNSYSFGPEFCPDKRKWKIWLDYHPYVLGEYAAIWRLALNDNLEWSNRHFVRGHAGYCTFLHSHPVSIQAIQSSTRVFGRCSWFHFERRLPPAIQRFRVHCVPGNVVASGWWHQ